MMKMMKMKITFLKLLPLTLFAAAMSVSAHHSAAMFDFNKRLTVEGTVKEWQWTNPHAWLQVLVQRDGAVNEEGFELGSPNTLIRNGFKSTTFKAGDQVAVVYAPRRNGSGGGQLIQVKAPDGRWLQWGPGADAAAAGK